MLGPFHTDRDNSLAAGCILSLLMTTLSAVALILQQEVVLEVVGPLLGTFKSSFHYSTLNVDSDTILGFRVMLKN